MRHRRFLFVNPPYEDVGVAESVSSSSVVVSLAMLAAVCRREGREVRILDLNTESNWLHRYHEALDSFRPDVVGITFATPLAEVAKSLGRTARNEGAYVIGGGPHASAEPRDTLSGEAFDAIVVGEGEQAMESFLSANGPVSLDGWSTPEKPGEAALPVEDLDGLPFAAVDLFEPSNYTYPPRASRLNPVSLIETSRGCYARCTFCNKNIFGWRIRKKSPRRVVDEIEFMLESGFNEIHIADDLFTADYEHAAGVCREILARNLSFPWVPRSGLRVDRVQPSLLDLMRDAGCYHVPLGIESGDQAVLDRIRKGIQLDQVGRAVDMVQESGMEATGYFMVGIPGESQASMEKTLELATSLDLDYVKIGICVPLPGTPLYRELEEGGKLRTKEWARYTYSTHPWEVVSDLEINQAVLEGLTVGGLRLMDVANKTLSRQKDGSYLPD